MRRYLQRNTTGWDRNQPASKLPGNVLLWWQRKCVWVCVEQTPKYTTTVLFIEGKVTMWLADVLQAWSKFTVVSKFKVHKFNTSNHIRWLMGYAGETQHKKTQQTYQAQVKRSQEMCRSCCLSFFHSTLKVLSSMSTRSQNRFPPGDKHELFFFL